MQPHCFCSDEASSEQFREPFCSKLHTIVGAQTNVRHIALGIPARRARQALRIGSPTEVVSSSRYSRCGPEYALLQVDIRKVEARLMAWYRTGGMQSTSDSDSRAAYDQELAVGQLIGVKICQSGCPSRRLSCELISNTALSHERVIGVLLAVCAGIFGR